MDCKCGVSPPVFASFSLVPFFLARAGEGDAPGSGWVCWAFRCGMVHCVERGHVPTRLLLGLPNHVCGSPSPVSLFRSGTHPALHVLERMTLTLPQTPTAPGQKKGKRKRETNKKERGKKAKRNTATIMASRRLTVYPSGPKIRKDTSPWGRLVAHPARICLGQRLLLDRRL